MPALPSYHDNLEQLARKNPKTAALLDHTQKMREEKLKAYLNGARLAGFEELLEYLERLESTFHGHAELAKLEFLVERARGEFGVALEALLTGFPTVAHDAMRAVMEIEFLFRDFSLDTTRINEWLGADAKVLKNYRPAILRQRFAKYVGAAVDKLPEATDYKGHSMFLHVGPHRNPFGVSGLVRNVQDLAIDSCFWEIFEHARRLFIAINTLAGKIGPGLLGELDPEKLDRVAEAWVRTQEMQKAWMQMIGYKSQTAETSGTASVENNSQDE